MKEKLVKEALSKRQFPLKILTQDIIEQHFVRCDFDDTCDICGNPEHGSYAAGYSNDENGCEVDYYLCGKCASIAINTKPDDSI